MTDWSPRRRCVTPAELEVTVADLNMKDPDIEEPLAGLIRDGLVFDSGYRRNGRIVWTTRLRH
jgi:hypothetical protein